MRKRALRIRKLFIFLSIALLMCDGPQQKGVQSIYFPDEQLDELFHQVQMSHVFSDSKTFPDCTPRFPVEEIVANYRDEQKKPSFNLKDFVFRHFIVPPPQTVPPASPRVRSMAEHIQINWQRLVRPPDSLNSRGSLLALPHSYVVPGGRFREIYYWDSYFTCLGLAASDRWDLVGNMVQNFAYLIDQYGFIPNGNRTYYLSRSQPPFFSHMVMLWGKFKGLDSAAVYLPQLEKEYAFWMDGKDRLSDDGVAYRRVVRLGKDVHLNRYWDDAEKPRPESYREDFLLAKNLSEPDQRKLYRNIRAACESGWDFSSRWLADGQNLSTIITTEIIPVDLNSLLYHLESTMATLYCHQGQPEKAESYQKLAQQRKNAIQQYCWDEATGIFVDYQFTGQKPTGRLSLATAYPLWMGIANSTQARKVAERLQRDFLFEGGMATTLADTKQQWDYPNGWPPLQWIVVEGLLQYDQQSLADQLRDRWLQLNERVYNRTGKMVEKYNVVDMSLEAGGGEYPVQDGFGWTNGVVLDLLTQKAKSRTVSK